MKIIEVSSKGKFMWFKLRKNRKNWYILNTYGLEGSWGLTKKKNSGVQFRTKKDDKYTNLYFTDSRNFGTLEMVKDAEKLNKKLDLLAPDFLKESFTNEEFFNRIEKIILKKDGTINGIRANKEIVKILMDQTTKGLGSGLGNYLVVEVLYKAKISPYSTLR